MRKTTRAALESLRRSKEVAIKYRPSPDRPGFTGHLTGLDTTIITATEAAARARPEVVQQETAARQEATTALYEELVHLRDIARTSPPADVPGFAKLFALPRRAGRQSTRTLMQ